MATSLTGCKVSSGSGYSNYTNCLVGGSVTGFSMFFYADYSLLQGPRNDQLTATRNPGCTFNRIAGYNSCSSPTRTQYKKKENASGPAGATYSSQYGWFLGGGTAFLSLEVGNNKATVYFVQV